MTLREYMKKHKVTQQQLAELAGVRQSTVCGWLKWLDDQTTGVRVTHERAEQIREITKRRVSMKSLRPKAAPFAVAVRA